MKGLISTIVCLLAIYLTMPELGAFASCADEGPEANATIREAEDWIVNYINELRTEPESALHELGLNATLSLPIHGDMICNWYGCFYQELETYPLARSAILDGFASTWADEMAEEGFFSYEAPDGSSLEDFIKETGYPSSNGAQIISAVLIKDYKSPCQAVRVIMQNLLESGISDNKATGNASSLIDYHYDAVGVALKPALFSMDDGTIVGAYYLVILLDRPLEIFRSRMVHCGHLYSDVNNDGLYEEGEGIKGALFYDDNGAILARSYSKGRFCLEQSVEQWTWHIGNRSLPSVDLHGISTWSNGELRQDIDFDRLHGKLGDE